MNLPPDQLKTRLEAGVATLRRLTDQVYTDEETHVTLCRAIWRLHYQLELLDAATRHQPPRA